MPKTFVTPTRSPLQPIMDRFVPRDDRSFVMASQSRLATTPLPSLRAQRGNPCFPSLRAQRGNPPFPSLRAQRGNPPFPSLRAKRGNPPFPSLRAKRGNPHTATNMDRFVPRNDTYTVMASEAWQSKTPHPQHINTRTLT
jgi:hypothetical protein